MMELRYLWLLLHCFYNFPAVTLYLGRFGSMLPCRCPTLHWCVVRFAVVSGFASSRRDGVSSDADFRNWRRIQHLHATRMQFRFVSYISFNQSINQSKHISIAPYVASESYTGLVCRTSNGVGHIINVKLRRARLVLDWWSTFGGSTIPVFSWPTQPGRPCVGRCSEYWRAEWVCFALWLYPTFETTYIEGAAGIVSHTTSLVFYGSVTITT